MLFDSKFWKFIQRFKPDPEHPRRFGTGWIPPKSPARKGGSLHSRMVVQRVDRLWFAWCTCGDFRWIACAYQAALLMLRSRAAPSICVRIGKCSQKSSCLLSCEVSSQLEDRIHSCAPLKLFWRMRSLFPVLVKPVQVIPQHHCHIHCMAAKLWSSQFHPVCDRLSQRMIRNW